MTRPEDSPSGYNEKWGRIMSTPEEAPPIISDKNPAPYVYAEPVPPGAYAPGPQDEPHSRMNHEDYVGGSTTGVPSPKNPASMPRVSYEDDGITPIVSSAYVPAAPSKLKCMAPTPKIKCSPDPPHQGIHNNAIVPEQMVSSSAFHSSMPPQPTVTTITTKVAPQPTAVLQPVTSNPPPGVKDGGIWGRGTYIGPKTSAIAMGVSVFSCILILFPCGMWAFLCPCDTKSMYSIGGKAYDGTGTYIGSPSKLKFVPME